jgi:transposase InsO family protein
VDKLCRFLEVSRSGYYAWRNRPASKREVSNQGLLRAIVRLHQRYPAMGLDSIYHLLKPDYRCSRGRVHRLMQQANIHSLRKRAYKATTNSKHSYPIAPNLLNRQFSASKPNTAWVGDITYIPTDEGWLYTAIVKDLCSKKIVGYAFSYRPDASLAADALEMAIYRERPSPGLIFHSDRGIQYASLAYRQLLDLHHISQSMSRKGDPYDNAVAENFFSCLKCELVHLQRFPSRSTAQTAIFAYIEAFYNSLRPHSALGWIAPKQFEHLLHLNFAA